MTIDAVCFDLDGTLLRDDHVEGLVRQVAEELARRHPGLDAEALAAADRRVWEEYWPEVGDDWIRGILPPDEVPMEVWRRSLAACGVTDEGAAREALGLFVALEAASFRLYHECLEVLDELRARGIRLAVVTNGLSAVQRAKLAATGLADAFDSVIVSSEVGLQKPDPAIFEAALAPLGVAPERALHIGDNLGSDVAGALAAGMTAVWVNRHDRVLDDADPVPDAEMADVSGLLELVGDDIRRT